MFKTADLRFKYYYTQLTFGSVNWVVASEAA